MSCGGLHEREPALFVSGMSGNGYPGLPAESGIVDTEHDFWTYAIAIFSNRSFALSRFKKGGKDDGDIKPRRKKENPGCRLAS